MVQLRRPAARSDDERIGAAPHEQSQAEVAQAEVPRAAMPLVCSLDELTAILSEHPSLYLRWSAGPEEDAKGWSDPTRAGCDHAGLTVNRLGVEPWWGDRPLRTWLVRRLYDHRHLGEHRDQARPWLLEGDEVGRGPDDEPQVSCRRPIAWVARDVIDAALEEAEAAEAGDIEAEAVEAPVT